MSGPRAASASSRAAREAREGRSRSFASQGLSMMLRGAGVLPVGACEHGCAATMRLVRPPGCGRRARQPRSQLGGTLLVVPAESGSDKEGLWRSRDHQRCQFSATAPGWSDQRGRERRRAPGRGTWPKPNPIVFESF
eukprot:6186612-Prymnesium_polylepis.1